LQDKRQLTFDVLTGHVPVGAVTVHHSEHPNVFHLREVLQDQQRVLVGLAHLRNKSSSSLKGNLRYQFVLLSVLPFLAPILHPHGVRQMLSLLTLSPRGRKGVLSRLNALEVAEIW